MIIHTWEKRKFVRRRAMGRHSFGNVRQLGIKYFVFCYLIIISQLVASQNWIKTYYLNKATFPMRVFEQYDKGYLLSGFWFSPPGYYNYGWVMKTDVNGNTRWIKSYGDQNILNGTIFTGARNTSDGGSVFTGWTYEYHHKSDPIVMKTNACGEKQWCRIYHTNTTDNASGIDIDTVIGNGYIVLLGSYITSDDAWLLRIDSTGEIIWQHPYATNPALFTGADMFHVFTTTDTNFIMTGYTFYPDSTYPNLRVQKVLLIKVSFDGTAIFQLPWGYNNGLICNGWKTVESLKHTLFTSGRRNASSGDLPCIFKTSPSGQSLLYKDLLNNTSGGGVGTVNWFKDSTLVFSGVWNYLTGSDTTGVFRTDTSGNILLTKVIGNFPGGDFLGSDVTRDNKLICAGKIDAAGFADACMFKVNSNLEFDSIYTQSITYDSLCPHPIVSDTISLSDCSVMVSIFNPLMDNEKTQLHIYPNPSKERIILEQPEWLAKSVTGYGVPSFTYYHQWKSSTLEIYDLFGKLIYSKEIPQQQKSVQLDVSSWHAGMYVARVVFINEVVASSKFLVSEQ
jgi:hypothetical protein